MTSFGIFLIITILIAVFVIGAALWSFFNPSSKKRDYEHNTVFFKKNDFTNAAPGKNSDEENTKK